MAHKLTIDVYHITRNFPKEELFGLTSQMRRSAASIGANLAEGCGRQSDKDFDRFLHIGMGSASELEYHLLLARDLDLIKDENFDRLSSEVVQVKKMLAGLIVKLKSRSLADRTN